MILKPKFYWDGHAFSAGSGMLSRIESTGYDVVLPLYFRYDVGTTSASAGRGTGSVWTVDSNYPPLTFNDVYHGDGLFPCIAPTATSMLPNNAYVTWQNTQDYTYRTFLRESAFTDYRIETVPLTRGSGSTSSNTKLQPVWTNSCRDYVFLGDNELYSAFIPSIPTATSQIPALTASATASPTSTKNIPLLINSIYYPADYQSGTVNAACSWVPDNTAMILGYFSGNLR